jgi:hypothetical protein
MAAGFTDWVPRLLARSASYFIASAGRFERLQVFDTLADTHTHTTYLLPTYLPPFLPTYLYLLTYLHTHTPNLGYAAACPMPIRRPVPSENQPQNNLIIIIIIDIQYKYAPCRSCRLIGWCAPHIGHNAFNMLFGIFRRNLGRTSISTSVCALRFFSALAFLMSHAKSNAVT